MVSFGLLRTEPRSRYDVNAWRRSGSASKSGMALTRSGAHAALYPEPLTCSPAHRRVADRIPARSDSRAGPNRTSRPCRLPARDASRPPSLRLSVTSAAPEPSLSLTVGLSRGPRLSAFGFRLESHAGRSHAERGLGEGGSARAARPRRFGITSDPLV